MTILEMHIGVNLLAQKINSNLIAVVKEEEMDFLLNNEIFRFLKQRTRPNSNDKGLGFQADTKRFEDLKALLVLGKSLPVYTRDGRSVFSILPSNCFRLVKDRSLTKNLCGSTYTPTVSNQNIYYNIYKFLDTEASNYEDFILKINGVIVFDMNNYPQFVNGLPDISSKFEMIGFMLEDIRKAGYEAKYENFLGFFYRESIIISSLTNNADITVQYKTNGPITNSASSIVYSKITPVSPTNEVDNQLLPTHEYNALLNSSFGTTLYSNPISTLEDGRLNIFHKQKFIISSVSIDFIRFPRKVSLPLNQSCDLDEGVHDEIVDNLAKRIAAVTSAENYQQLLRENLLKE